ncbi:hypothetical protein ABIE26_003925 [Pedobacter africanus]|uniref:Uncharacterized protein n=1 Tax=Pedobacter africanus TaxID=151894 RepID=A0ACC6L165_9SPHI|nr:hypothetical protein [Pedobacter africanus]MDR6785226.1 hypothetical protein [Pedobacter africanus]
MNRLIKSLLMCTGMLVLTGVCSCSKAQTEKIKPDPVKPPVAEVKDDMMIGIYVSPGIGYITDHHFKNIREANVDLIQDISLSYSQTNKLAMLDMAAANQLKMFVADQRVDGTDADMAAMVNAYKNHPATAGYYIKDEPRVPDLADAAMRYKKLINLDPEKVPHVNLFPSYATGALANVEYEKEYVEQWIELVGAVNLKYLSFDNYPFMKDGTLREVPYYKDLDIIRRAGLKYKVRTSSYLQSIGSDIGLRRPDANELRYSAFTNLAYGIKLPVWFTYWTPIGSTEKFTNAIVDAQGNKTDLYEPFKLINGEMRQLGKTLMKLDAMDVFHTGLSIPSGTKRTPSDFIWKAENENEFMLITHFVNPANNRVYIMVVNKSLTENKTFAFKIGTAVTNVKGISKADGLEKDIDYKAADHKLTDNFLPGEGKLYALYK